MKAAIEGGDRAEAWYEIRYGSNADDSSGIAKRRYAEADLFNLYDADFDQRLPEQKDEDAQKIFQMYTTHERSIFAYETDPDYASAIQNANNDFGSSVQPIHGEVDAAFLFLADRYLGFDDRANGLEALQGLRNSLQTVGQAIVAADPNISTIDEIETISTLLKLRDDLQGNLSGESKGIFVAPDQQASPIGRYNLPPEESANTVDRTRSGVDTGNDLIFGGNSSDTVRAGDGDDMIVGSPGADTIDGGADLDVVSYALSDAGVTVTLDGTSGSGGHADGDMLSNVEYVIGSAHGDILTGNGSGNALIGLEGNDDIDGAGGNDLLMGAVVPTYWKIRRATTSSSAAPSPTI